MRHRISVTTSVCLSVRRSRFRKKWQKRRVLAIDDIDIIDITLSAIINLRNKTNCFFFSIISSILYVIHEFWTQLAPFDASSATFGFCVNTKDVAYGNVWFLLTFTVEINEKAGIAYSGILIAINIDGYLFVFSIYAETVGWITGEEMNNTRLVD